MAVVSEGRLKITDNISPALQKIINSTAKVTKETNRAKTALAGLEKTKLKDKRVKIEANAAKAKAEIQNIENQQISGKEFEIIADASRAKADVEGVENQQISGKEFEVTADTSGAMHGLRNIEQQADQATGAAGRLKSTLAGLAIGAAGLSAVKFGVEYNAMLETSHIAWGTLLKDEQAATRQIKDLIDMAKYTPFDFEGLDKTAKKLSMAGFEGEGLLKALTDVGDAVSAIGGGQEEMEGISLALFQIYTKGKLQAQEMLQLAERGIPAWEILADKMGVTQAELQEMTTDGKVLANDVIPMLVEGMGERFAGSMERQAQSFKGLTETLGDNLAQVAGMGAEGVFDGLKEDLVYVNDQIDELSDSGELKSMMAGVGATLGSAVKGVTSFAKVLWEARGAITAVAAGYVAFKGAMAAKKGVETAIGVAQGLKTAIEAVGKGTVASTLATELNTAAKYKKAAADLQETMTSGAASAAALKDAAAKTASTTATIANTTATKALTLAQKATPWGLLAAGIGGVIAVATLAAKQFEELERPVTNAKEAIKELAEGHAEARAAAEEAYATQMADFKTMQTEIETLNKLIKEDPKSAAVERLVESLLSRYPELEGAINKVNGAWEINTQKIKTSTEAIKEQYELQKYQKILTDAYAGRDKAKADLDAAGAAFEEYKKNNPGEYEKARAALEQKEATDVVYEAAYKRKLTDDSTEAQAAYTTAEQEKIKAIDAYEATDHTGLKLQEGYAISADTLAKENASVATAEQNYNALYTPPEEVKETPMTDISADITKGLEEIRPKIENLNNAMSYIETGDKDQIKVGLQYADPSINEKELNKLAGDKKKAIEYVNKIYEDLAQGFMLGALDTTKNALVDYKGELTSTEEKSLTDFKTNLIGALAGHAGDLSKALEWLKSLTIPIEVSVTASGGATATTTQNTWSGGSLNKTGKNASGTSYWQGGPTEINEQGPEIVDLPTGSRVYTAQQSKQMVQQGGGINLYITTGDTVIREDADIDRITTQLVEKLERTLLTMP